MKLEFPLMPGIGLLIASGIDRSSRYPTAMIQKGLVLICEGHDLSEEAVGFGVPVIKRGLQTIFPSEVDLYLHGGSEATKVSARFKMNLEERLLRNGSASVKNRLIYAVKNSLAAIIRHIPLVRNLLTSTSSMLRTTLSLGTTYEPGDFSTYVVLSYTIDELFGKVKVDLVGGDFLSDRISEIVIMNELGAHHFDRYEDSDATCQEGDEIGCWDLVSAREAAFIDRARKLAFSLHQVEGARLYRGRELVESRLAWAGFGYTFTSGSQPFGYEITIKRLP